MENLNKQLESKIPKITESIKKGREVTVFLTTKGIRIKEASIKVIK